MPKTRAKQLKLKEVDVDAAARLRLLGRASEGLMVLSIGHSLRQWGWRGAQAGSHSGALTLASTTGGGQ